MLGFEASSVIALRMMKIAGGGPGADAETHRMISEKIDSAVSLQAMAMNGGLGETAQSAASKTLKHYRLKVRANRRRLTKSPDAKK